MPSVLLVCTANICRSPMAEAILKMLVAERPDAKTWQISSAGTWAHNGAPPAILSQLVAQGMGAHIGAHQSQPITPELIERYDLILTMERRQKEGLLLHYPEYASRIYMLSEMVGLIEDVPDPILGELADYQAAAKIMQRYLADGLDKIILLTGNQVAPKSS